MIGEIWNLIFIQPITVSLQFLTDVTGNTGLAIVVLTIIIQLLITPLRLPSIRSTQKLKKLRPHIAELKKKHKDDQMAFAQAQMELYRKHGINLFGGIVPMLLSMPVIFALYQVLLSSLSQEGLNTSFLWLDVTKSDPFYILPLAVGVVQFLASSMMTQAPAAAQNADADDNEKMMQSVQSQMKFIFPIISVVFVASLPSGIGIYWFTSTLFAIIQQRVLEYYLKDDGLKDDTKPTS